VNLPGQVDNLKRRQGADATIAQYYEDPKDQIYRWKKSIEMDQKNTDALLELLFCIQRKIFHTNSLIFYFVTNKYFI
jgi:hypothetical protein